MATSNLRQALKSADLQADDLAQLVRVDIRTVRRWLSGQAPYPRHRAKIARALKTSEQALWPEIPPASGLQAGAATRDLVTSYPSTDSIGIPANDALVQAASERIELLDHTLLQYLRPAGLTELLIHKASQGALIRIMVVEPGSHLTPLLEHPRIELCALEAHENQTIHRYDNQMLVTLALAGDQDEPPPLIHIHRRGSGGLFDRFAAHYQDTWEQAANPLHSEADIEHYLDEDEPGPEQDDEPADTDALAAGQSTRPILEPPTHEPRRWPGRPG